jgi:hypothetical protein
MTTGQTGYALTQDELKFVSSLKTVDDAVQLNSQVLEDFTKTLPTNDNIELYYIQTRILNHINHYASKVNQKLLDNLTIIFKDLNGVTTKLGTGPTLVPDTISQSVGFLFSMKQTVPNPTSSTMKNAAAATGKALKTGVYATGKALKTVGTVATTPVSSTAHVVGRTKRNVGIVGSNVGRYTQKIYNDHVKPNLTTDIINPIKIAENAKAAFARGYYI